MHAIGRQKALRSGLREQRVLALPAILFVAVALAAQAAGAGERASWLVAGVVSLPVVWCLLLWLHVPALAAEFGLARRRVALLLTMVMSMVLLVAIAFGAVAIQAIGALQRRDYTALIDTTVGLVLGLSWMYVVEWFRARHHRSTDIYATIERIKRDTELGLGDREALDRVEHLIKEKRGKIDHHALCS